MTSTTSLLLIPFILAFLCFALRFYSREGASSMANLSFVLALLTVVTAFGYLILGVTDMLPPYSTIGFAAIGLVLLGTAVLRMFRI